MARGIVPPRIVVEVLVPHPLRPSRSLGELVLGGDLSCEAETCRGVPLAGNWSETLPTGQKHDVLPVWDLIGVLSPPRLESWP
jgi:hypothetical protein